MPLMRLLSNPLNMPEGNELPLWAIPLVVGVVLCWWVGMIGRGPR